MGVTQNPCSCGSADVFMFAAAGGRGSGDSTSYTGECNACGLKINDLPGNCDGKKASAIREWNRIMRMSAGDVSSIFRSVPQALRAVPKAVAVTSVKRDEFAQGVVHACATLIEVHGLLTVAEDLLRRSGVDVGLGREADLRHIRAIETYKDLPKGAK